MSSGHRHDHDHDHDHDHGHGHGHDHGSGEMSHLSDIQLRVQALETVLAEKGFVDPAVLERIVQHFEKEVGPHVGAQIVAHAWANPQFKAALLADATRAINTSGRFPKVGDHLVAVENTAAQHNIVVCTLCSCYPWDVLGLPPVWYKSAPYRSRVVTEPRAVLAEFGLSLPPGKPIQVWDSTAETRYLVVPERPSGTQGWAEAQLAQLVTRDSMIGTGQATEPSAARTEHPRA